MNSHLATIINKHGVAVTVERGNNGLVDFISQQDDPVCALICTRNDANNCRGEGPPLTDEQWYRVIRIFDVLIRDEAYTEAFNDAITEAQLTD